jgi:hypothetical protein
MTNMRQKDSMTTLSTETRSIAIKKRHSAKPKKCDTQNYNVQHYDTQYNNVNTTLIVMTLSIMTISITTQNNDKNLTQNQDIQCD